MTNNTIKPSEALRTIVESLAWEEQRSGTTYHGYESARAAIPEAERLERDRDRYRKALESLLEWEDSEEHEEFIRRALEPGA